MSRYYLTCPLWQPPPPPPLIDQFNDRGMPRAWVPEHCTFANRDDPTDLFVEGAYNPLTAAEVARTYRCTTHRRRGTVHQRSWNATYLRERLMREANLERITLTAQETLLARRIAGYRPYPADWPYETRHNAGVWIARRPAPPTMHSTW